jgi:NAD-dependent DNA ligase
MIDKIVEKLEEANEKYRQGNPIMSDYDYDQLLETLLEYDSQNEYFNKVGHSVSDESRKVKLPIEMASMNKIKSMDDINDWCRLKGISKNEVVIITPKFDGLSLCVNELTEDTFTRGNGEYGQKSNEHYKLIGNKLYEDTDDLMGPIAFTFTYGEVMMSKSTFMKKYSSDFANPRNLVAGLLNSKEAGESLKDCNYIKYGAIPFDDFKDEFKTKEDILNYLNQNQKEEVRNFKCKISELTEDILIELFHNWSINYEIDGLIIEINDLSLQDKLGRETSSNNPVWARAFKHPSFEQSAETEIIGISWNISKNGLLKPVVHVNPIRLDGVTVSNVTGNNARFVKDMGIGIGAKVVIRRSGMVIPLIVEVLESVEFVMPTIEGVEIGWNDAGIELVTLTETDEQKIKKNIAFFEILEADQLSTGIITQLWDAGFKTIDQILNLTTNDLEKIDRFGKRKAKIVFESIAKSIKDVQLSKLQHATNIFVGMGSKKLALLEHFKEKPTVKQVMEIEGFAEISANIYVDNYDRFFDFIKDLPVTIVEKVEVIRTSNDLVDMVVVYTGIRDKNSEEVIVSRGGKIGGSVSKNTTHLVCKDPNSGSSKLEKAKSLGVKIMTLDDLNDLLKKFNK